jgi:hypothetical protein
MVFTLHSENGKLVVTITAAFSARDRALGLLAIVILLRASN